MLSRRRALFGLLAAPAIIGTPGLLMPVRPIALMTLLTTLRSIPYNPEGYGYIRQALTLSGTGIPEGTLIRWGTVDWELITPNGRTSGSGPRLPAFRPLS